MRLLVLRGEDPPGDVVVVIRGGAHGLAAETVARTATRNLKAFGFLGLSVYLAIDHSVDDLCRGLDELRRYGQIRLSTAGRLRGAGFALLATRERPHFDIVPPTWPRRTQPSLIPLVLTQPAVTVLCTIGRAAMPDQDAHTRPPEPRTSRPRRRCCASTRRSTPPQPNPGR